MKKPTDRAFIAAVSKMVYCNPFSRERLRLEIEALGADYDEGGRNWNLDPRSERRYANSKLLVERITEVATRYQKAFRSGEGNQAERRDFTDLLIFLLYNQCRNSFDKLILDAHREGIGQRRVFFYADFLENFRHFFGEERPITPEHLFACCFQLRRAFYHIFQFFVGKSEAATRLRSRLWQSIFTHDLHRYQRALYSRLPLIPTLVTGPSGSGKEVVARAIGFSQYIPFDPREKIFVSDFTKGFYPVNLSSLSPTLIESELFGHRKGAFTGALDDRQGYFSACGAGGTVFLDEIGETDLGIQVKLLRVLQTREFQRLGDVESEIFRGKIVAATNQDLNRLIARGKFREDFYFRLRSDFINTTSLVDMLAGDDKELEFLSAYAAGKVAGEGEARELAGEFMAWAKAHPNYPWPGNFRELEQALRSILIHGQYEPPVITDGGGTASLQMQMGRTGWSLREMTEVYVRALYRETPVLEELARRLQVDRRTVKRYLDQG